MRSQGPAVTLIMTNNKTGRKYSIDLTLAIKDKSWPDDADEWKTRSRNGKIKGFFCFYDKDSGSGENYNLIDIFSSHPIKFLILGL